MKKFWSLLLVLLLVLGAFSGCGTKTEPAKTPDETPAETSAEPTGSDAVYVIPGDESIPNAAKNRTNAADTLVVGMSEAKGDLLPTYYSTTYDGYIVSLVFDGLLLNDEAGTLVPWIAKSYTIENDNATYVFKLRDDVKFSDGKPLTAKDVAFTYTALCDPTYDGRYNSAVMELAGYEAYNAGDAKTVEGIKVVDDYTISFTFATPKVDNIYNLTLGILPQHIYGFEKGKADVMKQKMNALEIVGSGRYKFIRLEPKQFIELTANDNWFGGEVKIKNIITKFTTIDTYMQELEAGTLDIQLAVPAKTDNGDQIKSIGFLNTNVYPGNSYGYMGFNLRDERFADVNVRQALVYGFNRQAFIDLYYNGNATVCNTPISQVSWAYTEDINDYAYNPDLANKMLDDAGWVKGSDGIRAKDGKKLSLKWDTYTDSKYVETLIPMLKADWEKIGVKVEPNLMDFNALVEKVYTKQDFELYNMAWSLTLDPGDNYSTFHSKFDEPDGNNSIGLHNDEIDAILESGAKEFDREKRVVIYQDFAKKMNELVPYIFVSQSNYWDVANVRVKNFRVTPYTDWTYFIEKVELAK
jgi:peptide/nickel transport system substrate-binding protein